MAKQKDYSADAIIARASDAAWQDTKSKISTRKQQETPEQQVTQQAQEEKKFVLPATQTTKSVLPDKNWDYKNATTDRQGKPVRDVTLFGWNLKPKGFTPSGSAYFGGGVEGWLKSFAYKLVGEEETKEDSKIKWDAFYDAKKKYNQAQEANYSGEGEKQNTTGLLLDGVSSFFEAAISSKDSALEGGKKIEGLGISSPLTPLLRLTTASLGAVFDAFQAVSELPEQGLGANKAMREYSNQNSTLPSMQFEDEDVMSLTLKEGNKEDANSRVELRSDFVNTVTRLISAPLQGYDAIRFWTAPGTFKEKVEVIKGGWIEGRMLYSELVHPTVEAEFQSRAQAGEDPYLLAMELEDPWAEMGGELLLDPFNLFGVVGKAKKAASLTEEAVQVVEKSGALADPKFLKLTQDIQNLSNPAQGSAKMEEVVDYITDFNKTLDVKQSYKATALNAAGNQRRYHKVMGNYLNNAIQTIRNNGGGLDDVVDYVVGLVKRASDDRAVIKEGIAIINRSKLPNLSYNQAGMETGYILKQILGEGDSLIKSIKEAGTDWNKMRSILDNKMQDSLKFVFPSVNEMSRAKEETAKLLELAGDEKVSFVRGELASISKLDDEVQATRKSLEEIKKIKNLTKADFGEEVGKLRGNVESAIQTRNKVLSSISNQITDLKVSLKAIKKSGQKAELLNELENIENTIADLKNLKKINKSGFSNSIEDLKNPLISMTETQKGLLEKLTNQITDVQTQIKALQGERKSILEGLSQVRFGDSTVKEFIGKLDKNQRLADEFAKLEKTNPGVAKWSGVQRFLSGVVNPINGLLANTYFSLNYGYAFRNGIQNFFTLAVDGGFVFENGKLPTTTRMDDFLTKQFGEIPLALRGKTYTESLTSDSLFKKFFNKLNQSKYSPAGLSDAAEVYSSKLIYIKKYRQTMDSALIGALPKVADWEKAGFTKVQADDFMSILKAHDYDEAKAYQIFNAKHGGGSYDKWRVLDYVDDKAKKGLEEFNFWDEIVGVANKTDADQREVMSVIDDLKQRIKNMAAKAVDDVPSMNQDGEAWKDIADVKQIAGKHYTDAMGNEEIILRTAADNAILEMDDALTTAAKKLSQDAMNEQNPQKQELAGRIIDWLGNPENKKQANRINEDVGRKLQWAQDIKSKAKGNKNLTSLWDEAVLGTRPALVDYDTLFKAVWDNYYGFKRSAWDGYYSAYLGGAADLAKEVGAEELFANADKAIVELNQYRNMTFTNEGAFFKPGKLYPAKLGETQNANNIKQIAVDYGLKPHSRSGEQQTKAWLTIINDNSGVAPFEKLEDVPADIAEKAFAKKANKPVLGLVKQGEDGVFTANEDIKQLKKALPPRDSYTSPSGARVAHENQQGVLDALNHVADGIKKNWGLREVGGSGDVSKITEGLAEKMAFARQRSQQVAEYWRDFALLPYGETKNMDFAMSLVYPYQFWYSRSYTNWAKRSFTTNPEIISRYAALKDTMAKENADLPEWWKYQVSPQKLLGIETDNPIYFNLEATVWPLYGLTGTDFNDPDKRTNWFTATVDDMGKFGPSIWSPLQWGIAAAYAINGDKEIASKWGNRMIPQTATIKSISSYFGTPIELDPNVQMFSGDGAFDFHASDQDEEGRISRALAAMKEEGIPEQLLQEAARTHEGPLWDEAYQRAIQSRAPGQIMSSLFGVGFKARNQADIETDNFYADYGRMRNLHDSGNMSDEQYKQGFNELRERYPFMDVILLSRRAGMGRESAYAYNVISRIPPGMTKEVYDIIGVDPETAQKFYDSGGKMDGMSETEQARFMAAMVDAGAMLSIPSNTTRQEWTNAKNMYSSMRDAMSKQYGEDIQDKISLYFGMDDKKAAKIFIEAHPEVADALDAQTGYIKNNPQLLKFYGGMDTIDRYYTAQMYDKLEDKFGDNITNIESEYYDIFDPKEAKAYLKAHPELKGYWDEKDVLKKDVLRNIVKFGDNLPAPVIQTTGNKPENPTQERLQDFAQKPPSKTIQQWQGEIGSPMIELISDYWYNDAKLPKRVESNLDYLADQYGYGSGDEMLQAILSSLPQ